MNRREFIKAIGILAAVPFLPTILKPTFAEVMSSLTFRVDKVFKGKQVPGGSISTQDGWLAQLYGNMQNGIEYYAADYVDEGTLTDHKAMRELKANCYRAMYRRFVAIEKGIPEADVPR